VSERIEKLVSGYPESLTEQPFHYCPGCTHGIAHRLIAETLDSLQVREKTIGVASVGCSVFAYNYFNCDMQQASHGRAPAVATGIKRVLPDSVVFTYQGDGDLASIGTAEIVHAAARSENITVIFINNTNFGMTGGQMAPTTLIGQKTTTTPLGRMAKDNGYPIKMAEMLAALDGPAYIARVSLHNAKAVIQAARCIKKAFETQVDQVGFSLIEVLSTCPTNWGMTPVKALEHLETVVAEYYPVGVLVDRTREVTG